MRIADEGGTGTVGRRVVAGLNTGGHEVRALSRRAADYPADLTTGAGLQPALEGCEIVITPATARPHPGRVQRSSKARDVCWRPNSAQALLTTSETGTGRSGATVASGCGPRTVG